MDSLTVFGLFAVSAMMLSYAVEDLVRRCLESLEASVKAGL